LQESSYLEKAARNKKGRQKIVRRPGREEEESGRHEAAIKSQRPRGGRTRLEKKRQGKTRRMRSIPQNCNKERIQGRGT